MIQFFRMFICKAIQTTDADQQQPCHIKINWPMKYSPFAVADKRLEVNLGIFSISCPETGTCSSQPPFYMHETPVSPETAAQPDLPKDRTMCSYRQSVGYNVSEPQI
jgi:hypothetical protein